MIDIPVFLIQALHERQQCLQAELQAIQALHKQEAVLKAELERVEALLVTYPVSQDASHPAEDPASETVPGAVPTLRDCIEAILATRGPSRASHLKRVLRETYGLDIADSSLWDVLQRGLTERRYAKERQMWRLTSGHAVAPSLEAKEETL